MNDLKTEFSELLETVGISINGSHPWDIQVHNDGLYQRVLREGSLGFGEAYMDGWWDCKKLDDFFTRVLKANLEQEIRNNLNVTWKALKLMVLNPQNQSRAYEVGKRHYDIGNDLYEAMLDKRMVYTCGYWDEADSLDEAQEAKLERVCEGLELKSGQKILDIGCGWGGFAGYAAEKYDAEVVGVTVSEQQQKWASERCKGMPVDIRLQDYRELDEKFDHVVSLGMIEHVGYKNYRTYMNVVDRCLKEGGRFVLHTIGGNKSVQMTDPWIEKYIFPNSMIPSIRQLGLAIEGLFYMENWNNHGPDYDQTLLCWYDNFKSHWDQLKSNYSERFYRMWEYYLMSSAGSFRTRKNHQWEIILTR